MLRQLRVCGDAEGCPAGAAGVHGPAGGGGTLVDCPAVRRVPEILEEVGEDNPAEAAGAAERGCPLYPADPGPVRDCRCRGLRAGQQVQVVCVRLRRPGVCLPQRQR